MPRYLHRRFAAVIYANLCVIYRHMNRDLWQGMMTCDDAVACGASICLYCEYAWSLICKKCYGLVLNINYHCMSRRWICVQNNIH